eukprot:CAMPEP_0173432602 /NCGR_PEP_ID=MMETSP1357-20121228/10346_1 /TAXON_ID=77926 /ORGANISM="Hemiselmis rufescens, Strain PCC563" /LENGTH=118 /DNA_ID=CAMNT_0014397221 /DNA_START=20 /DNA_END=374 /DNA_ORIENTATION=-
MGMVQLSQVSQPTAVLHGWEGQLQGTVENANRAEWLQLQVRDMQKRHQDHAEPELRLLLRAAWEGRGGQGGNQVPAAQKEEAKRLHSDRSGGLGLEDEVKELQRQERELAEEKRKEEE